MPEPDSHAWWDDVQHLRASIERKREVEARRARRRGDRDATDRDATARTGAAVAIGQHEADQPGLYDAESAIDDDWLTPRPGRRFERVQHEPTGRSARADAERVERSARAGAETAAAEPGGAARQQPLAVPARRRTVEITGRTVGAPSLPRLVQIDRRRPARRAAERVGPRPDRLALWAVVLGFFLIFVAVTSTSHAAAPAAAPAHAGGGQHALPYPSHAAHLRARPPAR
jgi:hypothetical protein